jgi:hypothetical protein
MIKEYMHTGRGFFTVLIMAVMLVTGTSAAYAAEVPAGVTEVKIPLALESASAIAGVEIAFKQSSGLEYVRFEPASGAENLVNSTAGGTTWVGFFSATNKYQPAGGTLSFGNLVFRYGGGAPENVTIAETRLHSLTGAGSDVKSVRSKPNTVIPVTRKASGSTGGNDGTTVVPTQPSGGGDSGGSGGGSGGGGGSDSGGGGGSGGSSSSGSGSGGGSGSGSGSGADGAGGGGANGAGDANGAGSAGGANGAGSAGGADGAKDANDKSSGKNNNSGANSTSGASASASSANTANTAGGTNTTNNQSASQATDGSEGASDAADAASETLLAAGKSESSAMVPFSAPEITDGDVPLADAIGQSTNTPAGLSAWQTAALLRAGILTGALMMLLILKRKRSRSREAGSKP